MTRATAAARPSPLPPPACPAPAWPRSLTASRTGSDGVSRRRLQRRGERAHHRGQHPVSVYLGKGDDTANVGNRQLLQPAPRWAGSRGTWTIDGGDGKDVVNLNDQQVGIFNPPNPTGQSYIVSPQLRCARSGAAYIIVRTPWKAWCSTPAAATTRSPWRASTLRRRSRSTPATARTPSAAGEQSELVDAVR